MTAHRLSEGGLIERTEPRRFTFNGRALTGYAGDTLASALLANNIAIVGRSFKYHRPRGLYTAGVEEPNALVRIGDGLMAEPNLKATQVPLTEGLVAAGVNCWPSPSFDLGAAIAPFARFIPAGFYYKTFKWPTWRLFEPWIRRAAGLGRAPVGPDPDHYAHRNMTCDVLVVGAGPAGLSAALKAAQTGARVVLADEQDQAGGALLGNGEAVAGKPGRDWARDMSDKLARLANVTLLARTTVTGYYDHNLLTAVESVKDGIDQRLWFIRAGKVILATGAIERPLVFANNDLPGVMLAGAALHYLNRYAVRAGERAVIFTTNASAYATALALRQAGAAVTVVDTRKSPGAEARGCAELGIDIISGATVPRAHGRRAVSAVTITRGDGENMKLPCDLLCVSGGWSPTVHLFSQSGGALRYNGGAFVPGRSVQAEISIGAAAGHMDLEACLRGDTADGATAPATGVWQVPRTNTKTAFIDLQCDVTAHDIALAARENYISVEHLKRYTTLGMGVDQGKLSNVNGLGLLGELTGRAPEAVGTTRFRPPFTPVTMGVIAGAQRHDLYRPRKLMPAHDWHAAQGAVFEDYGWERPAAYPRPGETQDDAARREALAVRTTAGLFDGSPLGKIEVFGPDAGAFLDRIYLNTASTLKLKRVRYGVMLHETGVIIDDGVFTRLAETHYLLNTTSGGADRIYQWLEEWRQCEWPDLEVVLQNVTAQWAVMTLAGPRAREILQATGCTINLSTAAFPHLAFREGWVAGLAARVQRVSFSGELCYEIAVAAQQATTLAEALTGAGRDFGLTPYGVEAVEILRAEKGYLHVGADTDGSTLPEDVDMMGPVAKKISDFIGRRSLLRPDAQRADRLQFVGLLSAWPEDVLPSGAHAVAADGRSEGYVTIGRYSPVLKRSIALAMIAGGRARMGERITIHSLGQNWTATIVSPAFYDPEGNHLND